MSCRTSPIPGTPHPIESLTVWTGKVRLRGWQESAEDGALTQIERSHDRTLTLGGGCDPGLTKPRRRFVVQMLEDESDRAAICSVPRDRPPCRPCTEDHDQLGLASS